MFKLHLLPLCIASAVVSSLPLRADLIWSANFESYDAKSGTAPLRLNATGEADTFSGTTTTAETLTASACEVVPGATGNALSLTATGNGSTGTAAIRVNQSSLGHVPDGSVLVVSFDLTRSGKNGFSLANEARAAKGRSGKAVYLPISATLSAPQRVFIVVNQSGAPVVLPGSLGELPNKSMGSYLYDGTAYSGLLLSSNDVLTLPITGFATGPSKSKLDAGVTLTAFFDNFGAWTSATDTLNNLSVLSLPPGTVVSKP